MNSSHLSSRLATIWLVSSVLLATANPQTSDRPLAYRERTLANGMRVYSIEDHASPTVAIQVWYKVGSKDDPPGRSGFAHLFEHIMFKGTKNMKDEMLDRLTEDVGGYNNAFTADDVTVYFEVVPSNYLETLLWAEAERLASLNVDERNFKSERDVVKEEFRQNYVAPPYGKLNLLIEQRSFTKHPYKRPGIGNIEELNAATIGDVRAFHAAYYRPDNVTLVVAGDFDQRQLDAWIDQYFARIPKPDKPLPRVTDKEPARTTERRYVEYGANVPLPAVAVTYLAPPATSEDAPALRVAEAVLSAGESSRLYRTLVYEQQLAQTASARADLREDTGLFVLRATLASGKQPTEAERSLFVELGRMQSELVPIAELDKAKNQLVTNQLRERETNNGRALALGEAAVMLGKPERVNTDIQRLQSVTAEDVQRVMRKYFSETNRVVIHYLPESARPARNTPTQHTLLSNKQVEAARGSRS
ncbi:MAG: insulinase family protein [Pyrinomonadaceae bacterium]|nr:insulinase family protein [Pyrinomonadaceae bacterium]